MGSIATSIYLSDRSSRNTVRCSAVDIRLVNELNSVLKKHGSLNIPAKRRALELLALLFDSLQTQSVSSLERTFLSELFLQCDKRLRADLDFKMSLRPPECRHYYDERIAFISQLRPLDVKLILLLTAFPRGQLYKRAHLGMRNREDLTKDSGPMMYLTTCLLNWSMSRSGVLGKLREAFGGDLKVVGTALEVSVAGSTWWRSSDSETGGAQTDYAHYDEAIERPKAILYLSDVNEESGPTEYFQGLFEALELSPLQELVGRVILNLGSDADSELFSYFSSYPRRSESPLFRRLFFRLPLEMRFNSHFGWDVPVSHELVSEFAKRRVTVTGGPGIALVFDGGRVIHRGGLIQRGRRVVLQIVFGNERTNPWKVILAHCRKT